jgi:hypothetical protein
MASEKVPNLLKLLIALYVLSDIVVGFSALFGLLIPIPQFQNGYVSPEFLTLPYSLQAQVGIMFVMVSACGIMVSVGLWRLRTWARNMFIALTAIEAAAIAAYLIKSSLENIPTAAPYLILVDIAAAVYIIKIRDKFEGPGKSKLRNCIMD